MVLDGTLPARVNHLRIGEFALLGGIYGCYPGGAFRASRRPR